MKFSPQIYKAINIAARLHDGQERKGDGLPYITHPVSVALMLMEHTNDEDILIAGILHDTIEDTGYTKEQMEEEFGSRVTGFVLEVTELPKDLSWQERKDAYLKHLEGSSHEAKLICAADKLHNLQSMLAAVEKFGQDVHKHFNAPMNKKLWFYEECLKVLEKDEEMPSTFLEGIRSTLESLADTSEMRFAPPPPHIKALFDRIAIELTANLNKNVAEEHKRDHPKDGAEISN